MPYASRAQAGYFHTHKSQLEHQGVDVDEWDAASKGKSLPERSMKTEHVDLGKKGSFPVKKGALHAMLGISQDKTIPPSDLAPKPGDSPLLRRRKASAKGFRAMAH
jgi:hypothetical protein